MFGGEVRFAFRVSQRLPRRVFSLHGRSLLPLSYPAAFPAQRWINLGESRAALAALGPDAQARAATDDRVLTHEFATTASHTRPMPNRGPCLVLARGQTHRWQRLVLGYVRLRDRWEDLSRSLTQLVLGTFMVWHARRLRLCERYFADGGS